MGTKVTYNKVNAGKVDQKLQNYIAVSIVCLLYGIATTIIMFKMSSIIPELIELFNAEAYQISNMMSIFTLVSCILAFPIAYLAKRINIFTLNIVASLITIIGTILGSLAIYCGSFSIPLIYISRGLECLAYIASSISLPILIEKKVSKEKCGVSLAIFSVYIPVGFTVGSCIAPPIYNTFGYEILWYSSGIFLIISILIFCCFFRNEIKFSHCFKKIDKSCINRKSKHICNNVGANKPCLSSYLNSSIFSITCFIVSFTLFCFMEMGVQTFLPTHIRVNIGFDASTSAIIGSMPAILSIPFCLIAGKWADKCQSFKIPYIVFMIVLSAGLFFVYAFKDTLFLVGYIFICIGFAAPAVGNLAIFKLFGKKAAAFGMALFICFCCLGQTLGTTVIQYFLLDDFTGHVPAAFCFLIIGTISIIIVIFSRCQKSRPIN